MKSQLVAVVLGAVFIHCGSPAGSPADDVHDHDDGGTVSEEEERPVPGLAAVWAIHDGEKIERDDLQHPARAENAAWRDGVVRIFGGRNEEIGRAACRAG